MDAIAFPRGPPAIRAVGALKTAPVLSPTNRPPTQRGGDRSDPSDDLHAIDPLGEARGSTYNRELLADLTTLRFTEAGNGALTLGPVGVGKTHRATALGHTAVRRRLSVHAARADKPFSRLRAARLDNTLDAEIRELARVDVLILDDFALRPLDATETNDFYDLVVERHRRALHHRHLEPGAVRRAMPKTLATATVDRLLHHAHVCQTSGDSVRLTQALAGQGVSPLS